MVIMTVHAMCRLRLRFRIEYNSDRCEASLRRTERDLRVQNDDAHGVIH